MKMLSLKTTALALLAAAAIFAGPAPAHAQVSPDLILEWEERTEDPTSRVVTEMSFCRLGTCEVVDHTDFDISSEEDSDPLEDQVEVCNKKTDWADICTIYECAEDHVNMWSICTKVSSYSKSCWNETCSGT